MQFFTKFTAQQKGMVTTMESYSDIWENICSFCLNEIHEVAFKSWIQPLFPTNISGKEVTLKAKTSFQKNIVEENYLDLLTRAFNEVFGLTFNVRIVCDDSVNLKPNNSENLDDNPPESYTFENFVVGPSNRFAHAAAVAVAKNPGGSYNPLFIYGNSGLGKTHLLKAIYNEIRTNYPEKRIVYTDGEAFANEIIVAIRNERTPDFREKYRTADVLFIDDVHFIVRLEAIQNEFFNTFNALHLEKKQVVVTSDRPPKEIKTLSDRIRGRFEMGLLADIQQPDFDTRVEIIRRKADSLNLQLNEDVVNYIANQLKINVRQIEGTVNKLHAYKKLTGENPTLSDVTTAISDIRNNELPAPITIERIISEVARYYSVKAEDILSQRREMEISKARNVAVYISRELTQLSLEKIGENFGGRDHSTMHYAVKKIENEISKNKTLKETVDDILKNVVSSL